ncbi:uncharacterized protein LOC116339712 [Contarinia nasturtii]|uniref:uncharacterized protein LOC116339712 n=1 Tax=Contarinia nasturtii TaxID=265458 RepID=UPI0012D4072F|nr:uncharacterized protein LOC116339712 [Contarinia nasturtii]
MSCCQNILIVNSITPPVELYHQIIRTMECFLILAIIFGIMSNTWAHDTKQGEENLPDPTLVTAATYTLRQVCPWGSAGALVAVGLTKAGNEGVKTYQETHDLTQSLTTAAVYGIQCTSSFIKSTKSTAVGAVNVIQDIQDGKDARAALEDRTRELTTYLKEELTQNPNGKLANAIITGTNVALCLTVGPVQAWVTASLFKAMSDGMAKYKETNNVKDAAKLAALSGYNSTSDLMRKVCGLISSTSGFAKDLTAGKHPKDAFLERGNQAIKSVMRKPKSSLGQ